MRTVLAAIIICIASLAAAGCVTTGVNSATGVALISVFKEPILATDVVDAEATGKACSTNWFGIVSSGDSSIDAAKMDGDIEQVSSVDREYVNVLFLWGRACTVVQGK